MVVLTFLTRSQMMHDPSAEALTHWRLSFVTCTTNSSSSSVHQSPPLCKAGRGGGVWVLVTHLDGVDGAAVILGREYHHLHAGGHDDHETCKAHSP